MATVSWIGASGGIYNTTSNWSSGSVPGSGDTAIINFAGSVEVTQNNTIGSVTIASTAELEINPGDTYAVLGTIANSGVILLDQNGGNTTQLLIDSAAVTLNGGGTITLTNNSNIGIAGASASDVLDNVNNLIQGGGRLGEGSLTLTNGVSGIIDSNNGTMFLNATVSNSGLLESTSGGNLDIVSSVNNAGGTIKANGSQLFLNTASIAGGLLTSSGTTDVDVTSTATLDGTASAVTNSGEIEISPAATLSVLGTIDNTGTIQLDQNGGDQTRLIVAGTLVTLTGAGTVTLTNNPNIGIVGGSASDVLDNLNNLIQGGGNLGEGSLTFTNGASATVDGNSGVMVLTATTTNDGLLESASGGNLEIESNVNNASGTIEANGAQLFLNGASIAGGVLTSTAGTNIELNGNSTLDGSISAVTNNGSIYVAPAVVLLALGTIDNAGTILIDQNGGDHTQLLVSSSSVTLNGGGTVILTNNPNIGIAGATTTDVLVNVNNVIQGGGQLGENSAALVNQSAGVVDANSGQMTLNATTVTNTGLIESTGSGNDLNITTVVSNNGGTIDAVGNTVFLSGATIAGGSLTSSGGANIDVDTTAVLDGSTNTVTNSGTVYIAPAATLAVLGTIDNTNSILLDQNGGDQTRLVVDSSAVTLTGSGTVTMTNNPNIGIVGAAGTDVLDNLNNTIQGGGNLGEGSLTFTNEASGIVNADGGTLTLNANTTNKGLLESTAGGNLDIISEINNTGGTINADGSQVFLTGGSISGGLLTSSAGTNIDVNGNSTINGVTNSGSIEVVPGATLSAVGTIDNTGTIQLDQNGGDQTRLLVASPTVTLNGTGTVTLTNNPNIGITGASASDVLDNIGNKIQGGGQLGAGSLNFINEIAGIVDANSGTMTLNASSVTNKGLMEATSGGNLNITTSVKNSGGTISANGSQVFFNGATIIGGTLTSTAGTNIDTDGNSILNGSTSVVTNSGSLYIAPGVTLSALGTIKNKGTILLDQNGGDATRLLLNSPTVTLSGGGAVVLTNNPNIGIGSASGTDTLALTFGTIEGGGNVGEGSMIITLGTTGVIDANNGTMNLNLGAHKLTDGGLLEATGGNTLNFLTGTLGVTGTVAANGGNVTFDSGVTTKALVSGKLTGGTWSATSATLSITGGTITTDAAIINMTSAAAEIQAGNGVSFTPIEQTLTSIAAGAQLNILGGRNYTTTNAISNSGTLQLAGGTLNSSTLTVNAGAKLTGFGTIDPATVNAGAVKLTSGTMTFLGGLTNNGTVTANGGTLFAGSTLSGTGTINIKNHSVANFGTVIPTTQTLNYLDATGTIALQDPVDFHGLINGMVAHDIIDLTNTTSITSHSYASGTLTVVGSTGTLALRIAGSFNTNSFVFSSDGHTGTNITVT